MAGMGVRVTGDLDCKAKTADVVVQGGDKQFLYRAAVPGLSADNAADALRRASFTVEKKRDKRGVDSRRTFFAYTFTPNTRHASLRLSHLATVHGKDTLFKCDTDKNTASAYVHVDDQNTARVNHSLVNRMPRLAWTHARGDTVVEPSLDLETKQAGVKLVRNLDAKTALEVNLHDVGSNGRHATARVRRDLGGAHSAVAKAWYSSRDNSVSLQLGLKPDALGNDKVKLIADNIKLDGSRAAPRLRASVGYSL